ncbi:centrosomal P4.1-associated protein isoform X2 [Hetaerina americana]|uniref:centrosomal P4.1-associated protein isoform X2 n=1 Tax=Hetaerina americana TaxID=62018 RepID=UPI003A7F4871
MDSLYKGDLFKKLQEIKEWQAQQQEKLMAQQKEQQELLVRQHKKTMEMFGLKKKEKSAERKAIPFKQFPFDPVFEDNSREELDLMTSHDDDAQKDSINSDNDKENFAGNVSFDDVPLKPVQKDFKELLEEKLKKDEPGIILEEAKKSNVGLKPKRQFLKKGEGLKRFRMKPDDATRKKCLTKAKKPPPPKVSSSNASDRKGSPADSIHRVSDGRVKVCEVQQTAGGPPSSENTTWANVLTQKKKAGKENESLGAVKKALWEDKKNKYEGVDLEVFEMLEQMAGDSSFCSTSSTLLGFMESPVISTPLKSILEKKEHSAKSTKQLPYGMDTSGEDSDDSKGDFDSSSDSCYSEVHKTISAVEPKTAAHGVARVRFSNLVEEREFDPSVEDSSVQDSPNSSKEQFRDTEVWSDNESNYGSDHDHSVISKLSETLEAKEMPAAVKLITSPQSLPENTGATSSKSKEESSDDDFQAKKDPCIVFKSELLRQKMLELEHEIERFRKENEKLNSIKKQHEQAHVQWLKEKKETEKKLQEKEEILKNTVLEERKKFNREKQVFERYCKDLRNQPTKQEREEVQSLQQKLSALQQEMRQKESRNNAAQARITTRLKTLENENLQLKEEVEKLKKEKLQEAKKYQCRLSNRPNTKNLHAINNQLSHLQHPDREEGVIIQDVIPRKPIPTSILREESKSGVKQQSSRNKLGKPNSQRSKTVGLGRGAINKDIVLKGSSLRRINSVPNLVQKDTVRRESTSHAEHIKDTYMKDVGTSDDGALVDYQVIIDEGVDEVVNPVSEVLGANVDRSELSKTKTSPELLNRASKNFSEVKGRESETVNQSLLEMVCDSLYPSSQNINAQRNLNQPSSVKVYPLEKINSDGSREIRYENGNFKRISPDGSSSKLFYYNGDVKESLSDGTVKYYYSETRTWHTTFADGLEVLEFPNGQIERHCNGTTEVSFLDGTIRLIHPNGKEEVMLPDGTMATVQPNGDQLIQLPNGQKEYQTKEYKKRVYPDGTVKIVYSDGVQETRYANGRIRLRDADGNLVLDQNPEGDDL